MPARNRVTPTSEITSYVRRGRYLGNRGRLHRGRALVRQHDGRRWIICALDFRGRRVEQWAPNRYTALFFDDEAIALAAGHRPCAECRHDRYQAFRAAWHDAHGQLPSADELDRRLHADRLDGRIQRTHLAAWPTLPAGTFTLAGPAPALVLADHLVPWTAEAGYGDPVERPRTGDAVVLTPRATVEVLRAGYELDLG